MIERWEKIPGMSRILVSDLGRIKGSRGVRIGAKTPKGYLSISVTLDEGKRKNFLVHRLVLKAFLGHSSLGCNHKNGIKHDNRLINLEYATRQQNASHAVRLGLYPDVSGSNNPNARLNERQVMEIKKLLQKGKSQASIAKMYPISRTTVYRIAKGKRWAVK